MWVPPAPHRHRFGVRAVGSRPCLGLWRGRRHRAVRKHSCRPAWKSPKSICAAGEAEVSILPMMPIRGAGAVLAPSGRPGRKAVFLQIGRRGAGTKAGSSEGFSLPTAQHFCIHFCTARFNQRPSPPWPPGLEIPQNPINRDERALACIHMKFQKAEKETLNTIKPALK